MPPWLIPALVMGGSTLLGSLGKNKEKTSYSVDPYIEQLRAESAARSNPSYYKTSPSEVELATGGALLDRLKTPIDRYAKLFGPEASQPYYEAAKTRMGEGYKEEMENARNLYQREGILTSTPGVEGQINLGRKQGQELNEFSQKLMYEDIDRELAALGLGNDIISSSINQGTLFGNQQRQYQMWPYEMAAGVFNRSPMLGGTAQTTSTPNIASELGQTGLDIGTLMLLSKILGKGA